MSWTDFSLILNVPLLFVPLFIWDEHHAIFPNRELFSATKGETVLQNHEGLCYDSSNEPFQRFYAVFSPTDAFRTFQPGESHGSSGRAALTAARTGCTSLLPLGHF